MTKWLDFERLITQIYQGVSPRATVKHNDSIFGNSSGIHRQIDVSIRFREAGCDFLIIVQAKTNATALDVNAVGEFASVVTDVRASKGVLICNAGFSEAAKTLARNVGIDLCSAHDAQAKDWATTLKIPVVWIRMIPVISLSACLALEAGDSVSANLTEWRFSTDLGANSFSISDRFVENWNGDQLAKDVGTLHDLELTNQAVMLDAGGNWRHVSDLKCNYMVTRHVLRNELETRDFTGLRNLLTGDLTISKLKILMPPRLPEHGWVEIPDHDEKFISIEPAIVTVETPYIRSMDLARASMTMQEIPSW